jgi:hypothetical protein
MEIGAEIYVPTPVPEVTLHSKATDVPAAVSWEAANIEGPEKEAILLLDWSRLTVLIAGRETIVYAPTEESENPSTK